MMEDLAVPRRRRFARRRPRPQDLIVTTIAQHADSLLRLARRQSACQVDAEDACQRALVGIFVKQAHRIEPATVHRWLVKWQYVRETGTGPTGLTARATLAASAHPLLLLPAGSDSGASAGLPPWTKPGSRRKYASSDARPRRPLAGARRASAAADADDVAADTP